jgi:hypothetical protein
MKKTLTSPRAPRQSTNADHCHLIVTRSLEQTNSGRHRLTGFASLLTLAAGLLWAVLGNADAQSSPIDLLLAWFATVVFDGGYALAWLAAAAGYGWAIGRLLLAADDAEPGRVTASRRDPAVQLALGSAALILIAWVMGWLGWLDRASGWSALAVGWGLVGLQMWLTMRQRGECPRVNVPWPMILIGPSLALLLVASCVPPGVLWQPTEKGAYDVLSYHLQLPAEWLSAGRVTGLAHNVYAYLPSGFEAAFFHIATLRGSAVDAAISCQMLHAAMALIAAGMIAGFVRRLADTAGVASETALAAGLAAGAIYLAVPWVIVTGTLAYNEQAMAALGAAALAIAFGSSPSPCRRGLAAGLLVGVAMLCKLTAVGLFALPVAVVLIGQSRTRIAALPAFILGTSLPVGLFALRNWLWTGNPVFPMLTELFGAAHWTAEQAARWNAAHTPDLPWLERLSRIVDALLAHRQYGYLLWPAATAAFGLTVIRPATRRITLILGLMLLIQLLFWLGVTHIQSRFMVAAIVPAAIVIGLAIARLRSVAARVAITVALVSTFTTVNYQLYHRQYGGIASELVGQTSAVQQVLPPWGPFNEMSGDIRVYSEGDATPFYFAVPITYHTVWDASPLGQLIDERGVAQAITELRRRGYTHLLIDRFMLNLWSSSGNYGYDPSITPQRLIAIRALGLPTIVDHPGVMVVYDLRSLGN